MSVNHQNKLSETKRIIEALEHSQWKSPTEILSKQMHRLSQLIAHARHSVPLYQEYYAGVDHKLISHLTPEKFREIPILKRAVAQSGHEKIISTALDNMHDLYKLETSGSTGVAVKLIGNIETAIYWKALAIRDHKWHQRDFNKSLGAIRWLKKGKAMPPDGITHHNWGSATEDLYHTGPCHVLNVIASTEEQVAWLLRVQPNYLLSFPSQIKMLALYCIDNKILLPQLLEVRTVGESVHDELRLLVDQAWGVKLTDIYSSEEFGYIAIQCPKNTNYHIQSESVYCEVLNEHDEPCLPGETGKLVITSLHNFATPLIRYEIGDYATVGTVCECSRAALPVLCKIKGRSRNRLILPNGDSRFPYLGEREEVQTITTAIRKFQCIQHNLSTIEMKLVVAEPLTNDQELRFKKFMQQNLGYPFDVHITYHDTIPNLPNGKYEEFVSLVFA